MSVAPNTREVATPADHQCQPQDSNSDREQFLHASLEKGSYGQDFMYPVYPCGRTPPIRILHFKPPTYIWSTADKAIRFAEWDFNCARPQSIHHSCARPRSTTHDHHGQHCLTRRATPAEHAQQTFSPHVHQILKALAIKLVIRHHQRAAQPTTALAAHTASAITHTKLREICLASATWHASGFAPGQNQAAPAKGHENLTLAGSSRNDSRQTSFYGVICSANYCGIRVKWRQQHVDMS